jgi:hypothetical protein
VWIREGLNAFPGPLGRGTPPTSQSVLITTSRAISEVNRSNQASRLLSSMKVLGAVPCMTLNMNNGTRGGQDDVCYN